ncbi:MAG: putative metal-binding motif-containing protein [Deltaproteobacteria bacterium]|nr:putative metal-binding motif-containing protein [Deltaproteobacteria bacterium]
MRLLLPALALLVGCGDNSFVVVNMPPNVVLTAPLDGAEIDENDAIFFEGVVDDDSPDAALSVDWIDSMSGPLAEDVEIEEDGTVRFVTSNLEVGEHTIVLRAIDADAEAGEDMIEITIMPVPERPSVVVNHPDLLGTEKGLEDTPFIFMATVSDRQDAVEDLDVELVASPFGLVCDMYPDGSGMAQCPAILPIGNYNLAYTVTDTDGNTAVANAPFSVVSRGDYDMDLDGYTPNGGDCNDSSDLIYPGAQEICDGMDNDCIPQTAIDVGTECYDDDGDGYCEHPPCVNASNTMADCDDANPSRFPDPSATEVVNGLDDDCDTLIDEGTVVYDDDGDGYCETPPCVNSSHTEPDCRDDAPNISPGEDEICGDGFDNDCDGLTNEQNAIGCQPFYKDEDGDTYGVVGGTQCWCDSGAFPYTGVNTTDCYDHNFDAHPGQTRFFPVDRGDSRYDYNCDGAQEHQYSGRFSGCAWELEPFSCDVGASGWSGAEPPCGGASNYIPECDGDYDAFCLIFECYYGDLSHCPDCWTCDPATENRIQGCR